jgi:hypothetical protein
MYIIMLMIPTVKVTQPCLLVIVLSGVKGRNQSAALEAGEVVIP